MATPENPMAYLLELSLRRIERERPEIANDQKYAELKGQLLQDADGHFREIQATYATVLKTQCNCGGPFSIYVVRQYLVGRELLVSRRFLILHMQGFENLAY